ncbi:MAG: methyltransferase domain-containing protein [Treponemataceae bacterium]|nr:methyltransferase domain-containing protein [Treponemataceae bacterium]
MTVVVVQSRLGSTRLPQKGLLDLAGKPVIVRVLETMKRINADAYYVATDFDSYSRLAPVAAECGWECFAGSSENVLSRFCRISEKTDADIIVRATGDNPFLFYDAAEASVVRFKELSEQERVDYFTFSGLPHGSGVEVFNARTLLEAEKNTKEPFDHEHVGPAFYNHTDKFVCVFETAPEKWNYPDERTTIDTPGDFKNAERIMYAIKAAGKGDSFVASYIEARNDARCCSDALTKKSGCNVNLYNSEDIMAALQEPFVRNPILFVPSVEEGHGTGHLRRCLELAKALKADIFVPDGSSLGTLASAESLVRDAELEPFQIVRSLPVASKNEVRPFYSLIVADAFVLSSTLASELWKLGPVVALDEGSVLTDYCDYLLDIIPSAVLERKPNYKNSGFIPLPENRKSCIPEVIRTALVCIGGEDPAGFTARCAESCRSCGLLVTEVTPEKPIANLREKLADYDLVVTHYGFTAFEAAAAGCAVILVETTPLHKVLAESEGFVCIPADSFKDSVILCDVFSSLLERKEVLYRYTVDNSSASVKSSATAQLPLFIRHLSQGTRQFCPFCGKSSVPDEVVFRSKDKTYRRCQSCGTLYLSWISAEKEIYDESYFFEDYKKQYGRTYLEDFENIKAQGKRRVAHINHLAAGSKAARAVGNRKLLDIGCAFGPFLAAASESGWRPYGVDISESAVRYVNENLHFNAEIAPFPDCSFKNLPEKYDAVTMWYVIEHFKNLDSVLKKVNRLLFEGGIFAFSTPSASGVSALFSTESFFYNSPKDHFSILDMKKCKKILKKYGFSLVKCVSTGHHPERFPCLAGKCHSGDKASSGRAFGWGIVNTASRIFKLGDTFELYCVKTEEVGKK